MAKDIIEGKKRTFWKGRKWETFSEKTLSFTLDCHLFNLTQSELNLREIEYELIKFPSKLFEFISFKKGQTWINSYQIQSSFELDLVLIYLISCMSRAS